jgi:SNF2 family DNA or RNA helicase
LERLKVVPKQHQIEAAEFMLRSPYSIIALPPGMGKTLCPLLLSYKLKSPRILVVCPAYLIHNWKSELKKYDPTLIVDVIKKGSDIDTPLDADFVIISYDLAKKAECLFSWANMLVCDEAHYLKEVTTGRTEAIHRYIYENSIKRVYLLTGTPIKNRIEEYYSLISICNYNPKIEFSYFLEKFPEVVSFADHFSYRNEYEIFKGYRKIKIVNWSGLKNEDELKGWLKDIYFTRPASYPPVTRKDVVVCDEADFELEMSFNEFIERGSEASVLPQVKSQAAMNKTKYTIAYCKELLSSGEADSLVIYSDHIEPAKKIAEAFGVEAITGQTRPEVRQKMASDFQFKKTQVIVATIGSFSTGVTLTRANNMVFNDYPWVPGDMEQAEHRINRIGQTRHCVYHRILGSPQDRYILETIESKMNTIKKVT